MHDMIASRANLALASALPRQVWDSFFMRENRPDDRQLRELAERVLTPDLPIEPHNFRPPHWSYLPHPSKQTLRNQFSIVRRICAYNQADAMQPIQWSTDPSALVRQE